MKITENLLRAGVVVIALIFIAYGILKKQLNIQVNADTEKTIGTVLFCSAAALFLWGRRIRQQKALEEKKKEILSDDEKK